MVKMLLRSSRPLALALLTVVALGLGAFVPRVAQAQEEYALGDAVIVAFADLAYRADPGFGTTVIAFLPQGRQGTIIGGPVTLDGYTWYEVSAIGSDLDGTGPGWVASEFLVPNDGSEGFPASTEVVASGDDLILRNEPGLAGGIIGSLPLGMRLTVLAGPVGADGFDWYEVLLPTELSRGWVVGEFLLAVPAGLTFAIGESATVNTDRLNLRTGPGADAPVINLLATGTVLRIVGGPFAAGEHLWYEVAPFGGEETGWVAGTFLTRP